MTPSLQITRVRPGLYVAAELNAIHSPLTMLLLGISGAVVVSPREVSIEDFDPDVQLHHVSVICPLLPLFRRGRFGAHALPNVAVALSDALSIGRKLPVPSRARAGSGLWHRV